MLIQNSEINLNTINIKPNHVAVPGVFIFLQAVGVMAIVKSTTEETVFMSFVGTLVTAIGTYFLIRLFFVGVKIQFGSIEYHGYFKTVTIPAILVKSIKAERRFFLTAPTIETSRKKYHCTSISTLIPSGQNRLSQKMFQAVTWQRVGNMKKPQIVERRLDRLWMSKIAG
jgi:hypothetical protein